MINNVNELRVIGLIFIGKMRLVIRFRERSGKLFVNGELFFIFVFFLNFLIFL